MRQPFGRLSVVGQAFGFGYPLPPLDLACKPLHDVGLRVGKVRQVEGVETRVEELELRRALRPHAVVDQLPGAVGHRIGLGVTWRR